ncbi:MAG: carboxymuconolactone decarboxylase family protein [Ilumatobacter sp.]
MAHISPRPLDELAHLTERFELTASLMGFVPNSMPTMARVPGLAEAFSDLAGVVLANPNVPMALNQMVAQVASAAAGCRYCQAHTAHSAHNLGVSDEKLGDLWMWETSEHFDSAERAALTLAFNAASVPNTATEEHFDQLREHFDDDQILGIVATVALFGFLNRWNDTLATDLEDMPTAFAAETLASSGWHAGRHAGDSEHQRGE